MSKHPKSSQRKKESEPTLDMSLKEPIIHYHHLGPTLKMKGGREEEKGIWSLWILYNGKAKHRRNYGYAQFSFPR